MATAAGAHSRWLLAILTLGALAGLGLRLYAHASSLGTLDGDEAVWGLMARHVLDGEVSAFFWGQGYGGTQEVLVTAPLVGILGTSTEVIRLVPVALTGIASFLVWRIGRRTVGEPAARIAAVLFWIWPAYLVWKSTRAHGFYGSGLVLVCLVLLLVVRLVERRSRLDAALLGLVLGLGWWQTPQIVPVALPALAWLVWRRPEVVRDAWLAALPAALTALPWLVSNLEHDWWSFDVSSGETPYPTRLRGFFSATLPMALGLRIPFTSEWPLGSALSGLLYVGLVVAFAIAWWRRRSGTTGLLFFVVAAFPFLYALSPSTWIVDEPRYVVVLLPVLALLVAKALAGVRRAALAIGMAVVLAGLTLSHLATSPAFVERADGLFVPKDFDPLISALDSRRLDHVFASYWVAYRLDFETRERITAAEATFSTLEVDGDRVLPRMPAGPDENRHPAYDAAVRGHPDPGYVLLRDAPEEHAVRGLLERSGYARTPVGGFAIYVLRP